MSVTDQKGEDVLAPGDQEGEQGADHHPGEDGREGDVPLGGPASRTEGQGLELLVDVVVGVHPRHHQSHVGKGGH